MTVGGIPRYLIVNADDFGQSAGVNRGVIEAHERGIVTSASLMVHGRAAADAARYAREHPELSVGLHFDLGEWSYRDGDWVAVYLVLDDDEADDARAVRAEAERQLAAFRRLVGRDPTHLDSHQHAHRQRGPAAAALGGLAERLGAPLRHASPLVTYRGDFYGQDRTGGPYPRAITLDALRVFIDALPAGYTEMGCHPGYAGDLDTMYRDEREVEVRVLCDPRADDALADAGITLRSFHDLAGVPAGP